ncbi:Opy2 domain-containing protein [Candida albicans]|nr:hypothetical protein MG1_00804 [Candida albicans GC75]
MPIPRSFIFEPELEQLLKRDENGCVSCPSSAGSCPSCPSGQQCQLSSRTCNSCPKYYCASVSSKKGSPIGGIVGGVIGGVAFLALVGAVLYYFLIYRKKHPLILDEDFENYEDDEDFLEDETSGYASSKLTSNNGNGLDVSSPGYDSSSGNMVSPVSASNVNTTNGSSSNGPNTTVSSTSVGNTSVERAAGPGVGSGAAIAARKQIAGNSVSAAKRRQMKRLSSYESFTRPKASGNNKAKQQQLQARRARQQRIIRQANQQTQQQPQQQLPFNQYLQPSNRNSVATSFSNASNILPIAYIPGVTVRPTKNNTRSIYSYDTDSLFSDLNTIENASIIGDVVLANQNTATAEMYNPSPESSVRSENQQSQQRNYTNGPGTMTAIKAQPRLVNVDKIEEEDEEEEDSEEDYDEGRAIPEESEEDSDVDSDIGEITRATSLKRQQPGPQASNNIDGDKQIDIAPGDSTENGIPLDYINFDNGKDVGSTINSATGSFLLNVEFDHSPLTTPVKTHYTDNSNDRGSPFADPDK